MYVSCSRKWEKAPFFLNVKTNFGHTETLRIYIDFFQAQNPLALLRIFLQRLYIPGSSSTLLRGSFEPRDSSAGGSNTIDNKAANLSQSSQRRLLTLLFLSLCRSPSLALNLPRLSSLSATHDSNNKLQVLKLYSQSVFNCYLPQQH